MTLINNFKNGNYNPTVSPVYFHNVSNPNPAYLWLVIVGGILCFISAFAIGANDTGNAWASTIGSKSINVRNAAILAGFFEVLGAFTLGANVGGTFKSKIIAPKYYCNDNYGLVTRMVGMVCVDLCAGLWVLGATKFGIPVSTTHAAVGGVVGFAIITRGWDLVIWWETMGFIFISWVTSPLLSALLGYAAQWLVRRFLFSGPPGAVYRKNLTWLPILGGMFIGVAAVFAVFIGGKSNTEMKTIPAWVLIVIWASVSIGMVVILTLVAWFLRKRWNIDPDAYKGIEPRLHLSKVDKTEEDASHDDTENAPNQYPEAGPDFQPLTSSPNYTSDIPAYPQYPEYPLYSTPTAGYAPVPSAATVFDGKALEGDKDIYEGVTEEEFAAEQLWMPLCWIVASVESFSHGANDVGNSIGPYSGLLDAYNSACPKGTSTIEYWVLGLGAAGILIGLATYGHVVIRTLGVQIARITPQRAACAEFATVVTVLIATGLAIPVSTTHCSVGAIAGMGMVEGWRSVNWKTLRNVIFAIIFTVPGCALLTASVFGFWQAALFGAAYPGPAAFNQTCNATKPGPW